MDLPYPRLFLRLALYIGAALAAFILLGAASLAFIPSDAKNYRAIGTQASVIFRSPTLAGLFDRLRQ